MKSNFTSEKFPKIGKTFIAIIAILLASFFQTTLFAQVAPVNPPSGGFNINGELRVNSSVGDWFPGPGSGGSVFTENPVAALNPATSGMQTDNFGSNDNVFTNGSKFNDYVSSLKWFTNSAPGKNDISTALYHVSRDASNNQWIFMSGDRAFTSGTSYIDFELLQGTITQNGVSSGDFTGTPAANKNNGGGRTENDIIISMEYTNGGSKPNVYIYQWKQSGNTWSYQQLPMSDELKNNAFAETNRNGDLTNLPFSAFGSTTYPQYAFVEAGVNITYLLSQSGLACAGLNVKTLWVKTKASASSTAALKDYIPPISVDFQFGQSSITNPGPFCSNDNTAYTLAATPSGGTFKVDNVTATTFTPSSYSVGNHTVDYNFSGCSAKATFVIVAAPTADAGGPYTMCASDGTVNVSGTYGGGATGATWSTLGGGVFSNVSTNTGTKTVTATYTPSPADKTAGNVTLKLTSNGQATACAEASSNATLTIKSNPNAPTVTPLNSCNGTSTLTASNYTGSLLWSNSATTASITVTDNNTYTVTQKVNGCTSLPGSGNATVKTPPSAPGVSMLTPTCTDKTFSVKVNSPVSGTTYTLTQPGNANPSKMINYTTGDAIFTGLTFGDGYSVTSTNSDGCVSDPNSCGRPASQSRLAAPISIQNQPITLEEPLTKVTAVPNPYNNIIRFNLQSDVSGQGTLELYNLLGQKVKTVYHGFMQKGFKQTLDYVVPGVNHSNLIYIFTVGKERKSGILIGAK